MRAVPVLGSVPALALACLAACAIRGGPSLPPAAPRGDGLHGSTHERLLAWSLGPRERLMEGPRTEVRLLLMPVDPAASRAPAPVNPGCMAATSLLPAPGADPSVYLIIADRLYVTHRSWPRPELLSLAEKVPAGLRFVKLLALSSEDPQRLLAAVRTPGSTSDELWQIQIRDRAVIAAQRAHEEPAFASEQSFFHAYHVPRCQAGGSRCLVIGESDGRYYLDEEARRGQGRSPVLELADRELRDAAWARRDAAYVLAGCP